MQHLHDRLGLATEHGEAVLVDDGAVVEDAEQLVGLVRLAAHLRDEDLDLVRLHLVGEDLAERLRVRVGDAVRGDVLAGVLVPLEVREPDPADLEALELVVLADARERDAVVELADLEQGAARVLGQQQDAVGALERDQAATAGDALPGVVRPVLHDLFGRDVERLAHRRALAVAAPRPAGPGSRCRPRSGRRAGPGPGPRRRRRSARRSRRRR